MRKNTVSFQLSNLFDVKFYDPFETTYSKIIFTHVAGYAWKASLFYYIVNKIGSLLNFPEVKKSMKSGSIRRLRGSIETQRKFYNDQNLHSSNWNYDLYHSLFRFRVKS